MKGVSEDLKMFGANNENDEDTDWAALHSQDLTGMPKYIILPNSGFRVTWDMYIGILLMYIAVYVPYRVTFVQSLDEMGRWVEHSIDISFGVDIILNFFTAYFPPEKDGHLEYGMKKVRH